jgi:hypothetical protein
MVNEFCLSRRFFRLVALAAVAVASYAGFTAPAHAATSILTARDQGNGGVLLEWPAQTNTASYRIERTAVGVPAVIIDAGSRLYATDVAGAARTYTYRLIGISSRGREERLATVTYHTPAYVTARVNQAAGKPPQLKSALGTNLDEIINFSTQVPFIDLMKSMSSWQDNLNPSSPLLDLDAKDWVRSLAPGQTATAFVTPQGSTEPGDRYPAGDYLVRFRGEGTIAFANSAIKPATAVAAPPNSTGEFLINVTPTNGKLTLIISATNPANYLRDIEIIMPGGICEGDPYVHVYLAANCGTKRFLSFAAYTQSLLFNPVFLDRTRNYAVLRFMDWMKTNDEPSPLWAQRTTPAHRLWTRKESASGAPIEIMVALANRIGAHPWFNLPHGSDDTYAQNFAQLVKERLDPALGVYVEHSNELWNGFFPQQAYAKDQGLALGLDFNANNAGLKFHALRSRAIGNVFADALGAARVVTVLGAQATNTFTATLGLDYLTTTFGAAARGIDAVAIAPYFAVTPDATEAASFIDPAMTLDDFFNHLNTVVLPFTKSNMQLYRTMANTYGVKLISYEGGQHMVGIAAAVDNNALTDRFLAANRDPRIKDVYLSYLSDWKNFGGDLFVHYSDTLKPDKFGAWGSLEYITQPRIEAPKFDALQTFMETNPVWWVQ